MADAFLESAEQRFAALQLEGEPGIGKTTVWLEVTRRAEERGFRVLSCRAAETGTRLGFSALADLLETVPGDAFSSLPEQQRRALEVALRRADPDPAPFGHPTLGAAIHSLLAGLSAERPLLVAIDDVQWLDPSSASVLEFALRWLGGTPMGWLLALRVPSQVGDVPISPSVLSRLPLGPLSATALDRVLEERLDRPALTSSHEESGGNPLFALERASAPASVSGDLGELVAARLGRLPAGVADALLATASLCRPTTVLVGRASSADGLAEAERAGLVSVEGERVAFAHPLYASAVRASASPARREELHRRLAFLVSDLEERARHLAVATSEPDAVVAQIVEDGALLARSRGAWESAAELLGEARRLTPAERPEDSARRGIAAAECAAHAGRRARAGALLEGIVGDDPSRPQRAEALQLLAEIASSDDDVAEARRLLTDALKYADDPALAAAIELGLADQSGHFADAPAGVVHAYRALECAEQAEDRSLLATALAQCARLDYLCGRGVDWEKVERSLAFEDPESPTRSRPRPSENAACLLAYVGRHAEARERLTAVRDAARERGDDGQLGFILLWLSWLEVRSGNLAAALAAAQESVSATLLTSRRASLATVVAQRALVRAHIGDVEASRLDCADAATLRERDGGAWAGTWIAAARGVLELSLGDPVAAWEACEPVTLAVEERGLGEPVLAFFLPDALEALIALGELDRAERLTDLFEARGRKLDRAWALATGARCRGLLLAARDDVDGAAAALERAIAEHERIEMPFERARTLLTQGIVQRRARRRGLAKSCFEESLASFERAGARLWADRARRELDRVGLWRSSAAQPEPEETPLRPV